MIWAMILFSSMFFMNFKEFNFLNSMINIDYNNMMMISIMPLVMLLIFLFQFNYENYSMKNIYVLMFSLIFTMTTLSFLLTNAFYFIFMVEMCIFPMSYLIMNFSKDEDKTTALMFMFSINILGSIPFMFYSVMFMLKNLNLTLIMMYNMNYSINMVFYIFFILMLISKIPIFMFHFWLTKAHVAASGSCSMILASIMLKLGTFGLLKFSLNFIIMGKKYFNLFFSIVVIGYFFMSIIMMRMMDVKYFVACSSILHMSLIFPYVSLMNYEGVISSLFMMVGHGLISYFLFYLISMIYEKTLSRSLETNKSLESTEKNISMIMFFYLFLNLGLPPFISFYSELIFLKVMINFSLIMSIFFCFLMILSILFLMFYLTKILFGKKYNHEYKSMNMSLNFNSLIFFLSLIFVTMLN